MLAFHDAKLTLKEVDVLACLTSGKTSKGMAPILTVTPKTVDTHLQNILRKVELSSRDALINAIRHSSYAELFRCHYLNLLNKYHFEQHLKDYARRWSTQGIVYICIQNHEANEILWFEFLVNHFKLLGINVQLITLECRIEPNHHYTLITSASSLSNFPVDPNRDHLVVLRFDHDNTQGIDDINLNVDEGYYPTVMALIKRLHPDNQLLHQYLDTFKSLDCNLASSVPGIVLEPTADKQLTSLINKPLYKWLLLATVVILILATVYCQWWRPHSIHLNVPSTITAATTIHHEINRLPERVLLTRPTLIAQMKQALCGDQPIAVLAITGMGGSGKTTLARHYADQQQMAVVWKFNAETAQALYDSLERLATKLAAQDHEQKALQAIKDITKQEERQQQLITFVKERLRTQSPWLLIYDNVDDFATIHAAFPCEAQTWGQGQVIISTRDQTLATNKHVHHTLAMPELKPEEKATLFTSIIHAPQQAQQTHTALAAFLNQVPSLPLDVATAAYYIKATNIPL